MSVTASGLYVANFVDVLDPSALALDLTATSHKIALLSDSATPNFDTDVTWSNTNEVTGTGWVTGGIALSAAATGGSSTAPTLVDSSGAMVYDMNDVSVASTTLTNAKAARLYKPSGNALILLLNFGANYSTTNGTFGIQFGTSVFSLDLTP